MGRVFGRLTVKACVGPDSGGAIRWLCLCECGNEKALRGSDLKRGFVKSCGCWNSEVVKKRNFKHGLADTALYKLWQGMHGRTSNPNADKYHYYGGRGISVCEEWHEYMPFHEWTMKNGFQSHAGVPRKEWLTLDRIDINGNYEPGNCRRVTQLVQVHNSRPKKSSKPKEKQNA